MSAQEIVEQIKALPSGQRAQVTKFVVESDDSWIPEAFKQGGPTSPPVVEWIWTRALWPTPTLLSRNNCV